MRGSHRLFRPAAVAAVAVAAVALGSATTACAAVSLNATDNDATPGQTTVARGSAFSFVLNLTSTSEQTTGLNYFLRAPGAGSGLFTISDRNITGSTYSDPFRSDAIVEASPASILNPDNDQDLGASLADVTVANGAGTFRVATYTITVSPSAPIGLYEIRTFSPAGLGYQGPQSAGFADAEFNQHAVFGVTVVPEPTGLAAAAGGAGLLALARRRRPVGRLATVI